MLCGILPIASSLINLFLMLSPMLNYKMPIALGIYEVDEPSLDKKAPAFSLNKQKGHNSQTWETASSERGRTIHYSCLGVLQGSTECHCNPLYILDKLPGSESSFSA